MYVVQQFISKFSPQPDTNNNPALSTKYINNTLPLDENGLLILRIINLPELNRTEYNHAT
jgi:hypothetical protein